MGYSGAFVLCLSSSLLMLRFSSQLRDNAVTTELIATIENAHGVCDINCVSWCPRSGFEDYLATSGDDCTVRIWQIVKA